MNLRARGVASQFVWRICLEIALLGLFGCSNAVVASPPSRPLPDGPLPQFLIGRWKSAEAREVGGGESPNAYEVEFVDEDTVRFVVLSKRGDLLDGSTSQYAFIDSKTIHVDDKRISGGEEWALRPVGDELIIVRTLDGWSEEIHFVRIAKP